eukprot:2816690-Pyramimonas_sp.AAC.1
MTLEAQSAMCDAWCRMMLGSHTVVATVNSNESGVALHRPALQSALEQCVQHGAALVVATVDRLARNIARFAAVMLARIPVFVAEFNIKGVMDGTLMERSSVYRAALEAHLEGLRI